MLTKKGVLFSLMYFGILIFIFTAIMYNTVSFNVILFLLICAGILGLSFISYTLSLRSYGNFDKIDINKENFERFVDMQNNV
jgi:hypothetical protein